MKVVYSMCGYYFLLWLAEVLCCWLLLFSIWLFFLLTDPQYSEEARNVCVSILVVWNETQYWYEANEAIVKLYCCILMCEKIFPDIIHYIFETVLIHSIRYVIEVHDSFIPFLMIHSNCDPVLLTVTTFVVTLTLFHLVFLLKWLRLMQLLLGWR